MRRLATFCSPALLAGSSAVALAERAVYVRDFQQDRLDAPPAGFTFARTGKSREGTWRVVRDPTAPGGGHVLAQLDADSTDHRFPLAIADPPPLEDNVSLCRVVNGERRRIGGWSGRVTSGAWHALAIEARGERVRVFWEGEPILDVQDGTFRGAGKVGVWTKADSLTHFAAFSATPLR